MSRKIFITLCFILSLLTVFNLTLCETANTEQVSAAVGDIIVFGQYEQDNDLTNGSEPIEWIIIDTKSDGSCVLMSKFVLDVQPYNTSILGGTWRSSTLRDWLNEDFYNAAFTEEEKGKIKTVRLENEKNPEFRTKGGRDTEDKVWLLSINEVCKDYSDDKVYSYFTSNASRLCAPTKYAIAKGIYYNPFINVEGVGACEWWLRSPGCKSSYAAEVYNDRVECSGAYEGYLFGGIRPAISVLL